MAKSNQGLVPLPPSSAPYFLSLRLRRLGKQDVKKYRNLEDSTSTHAILQIEQIAFSGQSAVNQWLINAMVPLVSGNGQIRTQVEAIREQIINNAPTTSHSQRMRKRMIEANVISENKITNLLQQCKANVAFAESHVLAAENAMRAWANYFDALASIYLRARTRRDKDSREVAVTSIPAFSSRVLADVPEFEKNACSETTKGRK